jgi:hypothetical protein
MPSGGPCPVPAGHILGELRIAQVMFAGSYKLLPLTQERIAHSSERQVHGSSVESVTDQAVDEATASSEGATLNMVPRQTVSLTIRIEEGPRYRLGEITFKNNKAVAKTRTAFAVPDQRRRCSFPREHRERP